MKKILFPIAFCLSLFLLAEGTNLSAMDTEGDESAPAVADDDPADPQNPGMDLLDQATEAKLISRNIDDFGKVIALCKQAEKAGLSGDNLDYCRRLMAATQLQRGLFLAQQLVRPEPGRGMPAEWNLIRMKALGDLEEAVTIIPDQAIPFLRIAQLNLLPANEEIPLDKRRGMSLEEIKKQEEPRDARRAAEALDKARELSKGDSSTYLQVLILQAAMEKDPVKKEAMLAEAARDSNDSQILLLHMTSLLGLNKSDEALEVVKKVLEKEPNNPLALLAALDLFERKEQYDEALKIIDVMLKEFPDREQDLALRRVAIFATMEKYDEAIALLDELVAKNPDDIQARAERARMYLQKKEYDKGIEDIDSALEAIPNHPFLLILKAQLYIGKEDYAEASKIIEEIRKANPENDEITLMLVQLLAAQKKNRKALEYLEPLLEKDPQNVKLLRVKGQIMISLNRHSEAVLALEAVLKADPEDEVSTNNLSWLLSTSPIDMIRDGKRALQLALKACEMSEYKKAYILSTLAAAYAETGDFEKAVEWSEKSLALAGEDPEVRDRTDDLKKELESFKKRQPYREALEENEEP